MQLVFLHGPAAVGKLTVATALAQRTGLALFHNHLIVNAVHAVFPFGSPPFVALRESMWLQMFEAAAQADRSLIFTFAPENTVTPGFPDDAVAVVERHGGRVRFVGLTAPVEVQEARVESESRKGSGKLDSLAMLRRLRAEGSQAYRDLPAELTVDTSRLEPEAAAEVILQALGLPRP
ncbi:AAA family ATPase [Phenylobacterium aquaticum]|uniref:AAA family ATPase n=1 Tax=Phenylobacterium aquaticum TaxID=1763816 RepID=UPI001F5D0667|nr:shikimate kinase [Phenylobacterium aquaticum]MCI3134290.1 shikimate kinase [Phenylobacterium aquaticum]